MEQAFVGRLAKKGTCSPASFSIHSRYKKSLRESPDRTCLTMRCYLLKTILLLTLFFGLPELSHSTTTDSIPAIGIFDLMNEQEVAEVSLKMDFSDFLSKRKTLKEYVNAEFKFKKSKEEVVELPVRVRFRGRYRRMKCNFPPLKLKFKKDTLAAYGFNEFNELKLVTHCLDDRDASKDLILREYLAYRLYNILTPHSFRAQLVHVNYLNTKKKPKKMQGWGILIEDADGLAYRVGGKSKEEMGIAHERFIAEQEQIVALFQYMIGNVDWDCKMARNVEFIHRPDSSVVLVPYDFDFSGLVNAPYAVPNMNKKQWRITDRVYLGHCQNLEELQPTIDLFISKKKELFEAILNFEMLNEKSKVEMSNYLHSFFEIIEDEGRTSELFEIPKKEKE